MKVVLRIKDILVKKNMTQKELAKISGMREATISDIVRGARTVINFKHLENIANALEIRDIREIIDLIEE